jgi:hypothetical protein
LLVNFIGKETGANCLLTDFDHIEKYLVHTIEEPTQLFLIDYREPRMKEMLKQASLLGDSLSLSRHPISLFKSGKENDTGEKIH